MPEKDATEMSEAEIRKLGAQMRLGIYELLNAIWRLVDEELQDYPEARERVLARLDWIRKQRGKKRR